MENNLLSYTKNKHTIWTSHVPIRNYLKHQLCLPSYKQVKCVTKIISLEYRKRLAMSKEEADEMKATVFLTNMNNIEAQRCLFRNITQMERKLKYDCTKHAIVTTNK